MSDAKTAARQRRALRTLSSPAPLPYNATIAGRVDLTETLSIFEIRPDDPPKKRPWFTAGQYCVLGVNNSDQPELGAVRRPMSIASPPETAGPLEFCIRRVAKPVSPNPFTHLLWWLKAGDRLYLRSAAAGVFTIKDTVGVDDPRLRLMVAAGTGVAPFMSMLRSEVRRNPAANLSKWTLLHGASYPADLVYRGELLALATVHRLNYWPTVSRPDQSPGWTGDIGRVESFFDASRLPDLEQRLALPPGGLTPKTAVVYVCGLTGTIAGTMIPLLGRAFVPDAEPIRDALGVPADANNSFFYERYDTRPVIDLSVPELVEPLRLRMQAALAKA